MPHRRRARRASGPQPERPRGRPRRGRVRWRTPSPRRHRDRPAGRDQTWSSTPIRWCSSTHRAVRRRVSPLGAGGVLAGREQPIAARPGVEVEGSIPNAQRFDSSGQPILTPSTPYSLTIRDLYQGIPVNPEPSYWCGLRTLLRPTAQGDPPPPMLIVDPATFRALPKLNLSRIVEVRPDPKGLTRVDAKKLSAARRDRDHVLEHGHGYADGVRSASRSVARCSATASPHCHHADASDVVARTVAADRRSRRAAALDHGRAMLARTRERADWGGGQPGRGRRRRSWTQSGPWASRRLRLALVGGSPWADTRARARAWYAALLAVVGAVAGPCSSRVIAAITPDGRRAAPAPLGRGGFGRRRS